MYGGNGAAECRRGMFTSELTFNLRLKKAWVASTMDVSGLDIPVHKY